MGAGFGAFFRSVWGQPLARAVDVNGADAISVHRRILDSNPALGAHYRRWYSECLPAWKETENILGEVVEIGSGAGFLEEAIPGLVRTDAVANPLSHRVIDAERMAFGDGTLRAIFVIGVLHHLSRPGKFLAEAERCLKPGGRLVLLEPHNSFPQRFLCRLLDHYEYFDDEIAEWANQDSGRMTRANLALPWVIFVRDRARFEAEFPSLRIRAIRHHTFISYLVTGGMSYRPFIPSFALPLVSAAEFLARPFMSWVGTMMTIDIVRI